MSKVFIHIGYPKTATTMLQKHLFANANNLLYLGKPFAELFKSSLKKEFRLELEEYFSATNKQLQEKMDLNLKDLGYPI
jgi:hypothetical protein